MREKPTVLQVHNLYQIPGGEDTVADCERNLLEAHGHRVVRYFRDNKELKRLSAFEKLLLPVTAVFSFRTYREVRRLIRAEQIDLVHVHNTLSLISPSVYYAALAEGVPVVQTVHNFRLLCPGATFYRDGHICEDCLSGGLGCAVKHRCYRGSRLQTLVCVITTKIHRMTGIYGKLSYICLTEFNREKLLHLKQVRPERVYIKPNFVENCPEPILPEESRLNQIVYAGRLEKLKGVDVLLESWRLLGEDAPRLILCGTGPLEDWCRDYIRENGIRNVQMRGFTPNAEVRRLMAQSRALILPTQCYEGFPMTILEAFSVGTPVLCSDLGNAGSIVREGVTGRKFKPDSPEDLARVVRTLGGMCENACAEYLRTYCAERNYEILAGIYGKTLQIGS